VRGDDRLMRPVGDSASGGRRLLVVLLLAIGACYEAPTKGGSTSSLVALPGLWVVTQVDTQTVAPFITHYVCSQTSGTRLLEEEVAESLALDTTGTARRHVVARQSWYQDTLLVDGPTPIDFVSVGSFSPTVAVVLDAADSAVAVSLRPPPGTTGASYTLYLARADSTLLYRIAMQDNCGRGLIGDDRVARLTKR